MGRELKLPIENSCTTYKNSIFATVNYCVFYRKECKTHKRSAADMTLFESLAKLSQFIEFRLYSSKTFPTSFTHKEIDKKPHA